jgi:hypothetical protein
MQPANAGSPGCSSAPLAFPRITGNRFAVVAVLAQQLADLDLDQVDDLRIVRQIALVDEHDQVRHSDLPGEQDVLAGLRHRSIDRAGQEDRSVHLGRAGDHVLDVIGVAGTVDVGVMPPSKSRTPRGW